MLGRHSETRSARGARIDVVLWALFLIWIGAIALFKGIPTGLGSIGVGAIVLLGSLIRLIVGVSVSTFWIIIGLVFLLAGGGEMLGIDLPLLPMALIICGVLLLFHRRSGRRGRA